MHSIRFKITAITVAAILTTIISVFVISYTPIRVENDRKSAEMMDLLCQSRQKALNEYFESIEQSVETAAFIADDSLDSVVLVESGAAGSAASQRVRTVEREAQFSSYLADYCSSVQEAFASIASHTLGVVTYYYCINPEISETEHGFFYSKVGKTGFDMQEPLDARELDPEDIAHTTWYYTPIERGRPSWVGPYTAHFLDEMWICSYLVPIYKAGAFIGVLGMDIPMETLVSQISSVKVYQSGFACLLDPEGRVLYHPSLPVGSVPEFSDLSVDLSILREKSSGDTLIRYTAEGEQRQMSFATLSSGMKLVITAPIREINASSSRLATTILLATAFIMAFFIMIHVFALRLLTWPLKRLTAASQRLAAADYDVALDYESKDEIGELTKAFKRMRDQLKLNIEDLNRRVRTDALTGLPNMRYFFKLAEQERQKLAESGQSPVILYFNLIGMKYYNRQYGFDAGDTLLREIAAILVRHYGELNLCRFSEDHFAAICEESGLEEELQALFQDCREANGGNSLPVSVGIYPSRLEAVSISVACDHAKYACDQRSSSIGSGFCYFDRNMLYELENVRYIINHLDQALAEHWIQVYYQPIIRAVNGRVCEEEALSRWLDPVKGMLSPAEFIPVLEKARLIYKLDLYVLDEILRKIQNQRQAGMQIVPQSLNLSRVDFDMCDIVGEICRRVDAAGVRREKLTIEVTESIVGRDFEFMKQQIQRFQALGFHVWMDDFGSGYSSLDTLQDVRFDLIKFDMRFMQRFDESGGSRIILTELFRMAIGLGIETVCEGVESADQVEFLREIGCTKLQGYFFGRPIPEDEIISRFREGRLVGFENPLESEYYAAIGKANLNDLGVIEEESGFRSSFDSLPMGIVAFRGDSFRFMRTNRSFREFVKHFFSLEPDYTASAYSQLSSQACSAILNPILERCSDGGRAFCEETLLDGSIVQIFGKHISANSVTGETAIGLAVLSVTESSKGSA